MKINKKTTTETTTDVVVSKSLLLDLLRKTGLDIPEDRINVDVCGPNGWTRLRDQDRIRVVWRIGNTA